MPVLQTTALKAKTLKLAEQKYIQLSVQEEINIFYKSQFKNTKPVVSAVAHNQTSIIQ